MKDKAFAEKLRKCKNYIIDTHITKEKYGLLQF